MYELLKFIYKLYRKPIKWFAFNIRQFFYFIYPNRVNLILNRIIYNTSPVIHQFTICSGNGVVEIGNNCSFGYKMGGFHRGGSIELQARYKNSRIKIGKDISTNNNIFLCAANYIEIGDNTLVGQNVIIIDHEAHGIEPIKEDRLVK